MVAKIEPGMTVGEAAKANGIVNFDTALPQEWVNDVERLTGSYAVGGTFEGEPVWFVWSYDPPAKMWGQPMPLTEAAERLLALYETKRRGGKA